MINIIKYKKFMNIIVPTSHQRVLQLAIALNYGNGTVVVDEGLIGVLQANDIPFEVDRLVRKPHVQINFEEHPKTHVLQNNDNCICVICQSVFQRGDEIVSLSDCKHNFHTHCLSNWVQYKGTCPVCNAAITTKNRHQ